MNSQIKIFNKLTVIVLTGIFVVSLLGCSCQMVAKHKAVVIPSDLVVPSKITSGVLIESDVGVETAPTRVSAYDTSDGRRLWEFDDMAALSYAKIYGNEVFAPLDYRDFTLPDASVSGGTCKINALHARTGKKLREYKLWTTDSLGKPKSGEDSRIFWISDFDISDKYIAAMSTGNKCKVIDRQGGKTVFEKTVSGKFVNMWNQNGNALELVDSTLYIGGAQVSAYDLNSGGLLWERDLKPSSGITITSQGLVFDTEEKKKYCLYLLDANSGKTIWRTENRNEWADNIAANGDRLLCEERRIEINYPSTLVCIDLKTGEKLWSFENSHDPEGLNSAPLIFDDVVYYQNGDGHFYALDLTTGEVIAKNDATGGDPLTDDHYVYTLYDGKIYKFRKAVKGSTWPAPIILPP